MPNTISLDQYKKNKAIDDEQSTDGFLKTTANMRNKTLPCEVEWLFYYTSITYILS
jgi:hypothetical protein